MNAVRLICTTLTLLSLLASQVCSASAELRIRPLHPTSSTPILIDVVADGMVDCLPSGASVSRDGFDVRVDLIHDLDCAPSTDGFQTNAKPEKSALRWAKRGVFRIRLFDHNGPGASERLLSFRVIEVDSSTPRNATPEPGFWWSEAGGDFDQAGPGLGLNLEQQGNTISVSVMGYSADGAPEWLLGAGEIVGSVAHVALTRFSGGNGPFTQFASPKSAGVIGTLDLEFNGRARAIAWFSQPGENGSIHVQPMSLVRFRFNTDQAQAWLGSWVILAEQASGSTSPDPLVMKFDQVEAMNGGFRLIDSGRSVSLDCAESVDRPNSPPTGCILRDADGATLVEFDETAVNSLSGWRVGTGRVRAIHGVD